MLSTDVYNLEVLPGTRNHKGCFVQEVTYKLIRVNSTGWAFICLDDVSCHYVDPDNLQAASDRYSES